MPTGDEASAPIHPWHSVFPQLGSARYGEWPSDFADCFEKATSSAVDNNRSGQIHPRKDFETGDEASHHMEATMITFLLAPRAGNPSRNSARYSWAEARQR